MKPVLLGVVLVSLAAMDAAAAARATDVDYIRANRCRALANAIPGQIDAAAIDAFVKAEGRSRTALVQERADAEYARARKEARGEDRKERLTRELGEVCQAYARPTASAGAI